MTKLLLSLAATILICISCERQVEVSPIKGVWECQMNGATMTLEYGNRDVKYICYTELFDATAIYKGTYTIQGNEIQQEFTSLTKKNSSKIEYYSPEEMPKEAVQKGNDTIIYMDYTFVRK